MNYYDDDEYSSAASFRARSNTWPLNRPDLATPNGVSIDETLPEIDLEEDDLFTTNDNWNGVLVDHDIMSWDPILNAQRYQSSGQFHTNDNGTATAPITSAPAPTTVPATNYPQQQPHYHQNASTTTTANVPPSANVGNNIINNNRSHVQDHQQQPQQQQQIHLHNSSKVSSQPQQQQQTIHGQQQQQQQHHHHHQPISNASGINAPNTSHIYTTTSHQLNDNRIQDHELQPPHNNHLQQSQVSPQQLNHNQQQQHQTQHHPQSQHQHHQHQQQHQQHQQQQQPPLNNSHRLDPDDHIQQMHHLSLDGNNHIPSDQQHHHHQQQQQLQSSHYIPTISSSSSPSMCVYGASNPIEIDSYNISPNHPHHHLQQLISTSYDIDHHNELESSHEHQIHQMTSSSHDPNSSTHQLSSSLSTSGIGLSCDLDEQDYKVVDPSMVLQNSNFNDQLLDSQPTGLNHLQHQQPHQQSNTHLAGPIEASGGSSKPQSSSASSSSSKTKLNAPRRNAWGNMSYADLITQAINSTNDKRLTLSEIYDWMVQQVPYFKDKGDSTSSAGWKNSVRHNLSLHSRFKRLQNEGTGKSSWWTINPEANIGKCARRRAASMEASKYEKKRGRAKKKAEAVRQGLISYPSLTSSSLNGSASNLNQSRLDLTADQYPPPVPQNPSHNQNGVLNHNQDQQTENETSGGDLHLLLAPTSYCCAFTQQSANQISGSPAFLSS